MSFQINFNTHGKELNAAYQAVISEKDETNWLIYAFDKGTYDLRVQATGGKLEMRKFMRVISLKLLR
jgi:hypothetical protein